MFNNNNNDYYVAMLKRLSTVPLPSVALPLCDSLRPCVPCKVVGH